MQSVKILSAQGLRPGWCEAKQLNSRDASFWRVLTVAKKDGFSHTRQHTGDTSVLLIDVSLKADVLSASFADKQ